MTMHKQPWTDWLDTGQLTQRYPLLAKLQGMRVLVTGGLGFLGSNLAIALVRLGAEVTIVDRLLTSGGGDLYNIEPVRGAVEVYKRDIRQRAFMNTIVRDKDVIFHLAAHTSHIESVRIPFNDLSHNCIGTLSILEACRYHNPRVRLIYSGSRAEYGAPVEIPVKEESLCRPLDIYAINKLASEQYCRLYGQLYGLKVVTFRLNNAYGPRAQMHHSKFGVLNWFIRLAMDDKTIPIFGDGSQIRDYCYVSDVTDAMLLAICNEDAMGKVFNLGSEQPRPFLEMVQLAIRAAGSGRYKLVPWPEMYSKIDVGDYEADCSKIQRLLGWQPQITMEEGLRKTVAFYRKHKAHYWGERWT